MDEKPPKHIYLQWYDISSDTGATWCIDRINDTDVRYILYSEYKSLFDKAASDSPHPLKLYHQNGDYYDAIPNLMETLRLMDGSTMEKVAAQLNVVPGTIRNRIARLEKRVGGLVLERGRPWKITELGRQVLEANEEVSES
jgi:hypothetical protein